MFSASFRVLTWSVRVKKCFSRSAHSPCEWKRSIFALCAKLHRSRRQIGVRPVKGSSWWFPGPFSRDVKLKKKNHHRPLTSMPSSEPCPWCQLYADILKASYSVTLIMRCHSKPIRNFPPNRHPSAHHSWESGPQFKKQDHKKFWGLYRCRPR